MRVVAQCMVIALLCMWIGGEIQETTAQTGPATPGLVCLTFSPEVSPTNSQPFRQALAYAIDRDAVAKAAQVDPRVPYYPASTIQHPKLAGFNPDAPGYSYDPAKAKALYAQSAWSGPIVISIPPKLPARSARAAIHGAVRDNIQRTLGAEVILQEAVSFDRLLISARRGQTPAIIAGWVSNPRDYGYPSFALGLADDFDFARRDPDLPILIQRGDSKGVEQVLLEKALIIPIVHN